MELSAGTFRLEGHIDVPVDRLEAVSIALLEHIRLTREEPGCLFFNVDPCPDVEGRFLVSEAFVDEAAFNAHQDRAKGSEWAKVTEGIERDFRTWVVQVKQHQDVGGFPLLFFRFQATKYSRIQAL